MNNQKPVSSKESYDNNMKLNLLNVINNDRIANQIIEKEEVDDEKLDNSPGQGNLLIFSILR